MKTEHSNGAASANPAVTDAEQRPGFPNPIHLTSKSLPNSRKVYAAGKKYVGLRVPFREIPLAPTKSMNGETEVNEPVRVYDTSGPWGDQDFHGDVTQGLPALRAEWIRARSDVEEYEGRVVRPIDDGYLSDKHAAVAVKRQSFNGAGAPSRRKPLRASA